MRFCALLGPDIYLGTWLGIDLATSLSLTILSVMKSIHNKVFRVHDSTQDHKSSAYSSVVTVGRKYTRSNKPDLYYPQPRSHNVGAETLVSRNDFGRIDDSRTDDVNVEMRSIKVGNMTAIPLW